MTLEHPQLHRQKQKQPVNLSPPSLLNQAQYLSEIRTILTHPFFTGVCPACKHSMHISSRVQGGSRCRTCGWEENRPITLGDL
ncbi:hypothetical protein [Lyngbya confervoides]|uniref:Transposase zinc-ribbon domain-containing protein n=1 Tax=Lyngbya confervoides BDU141951 TaxID=1574623 RepID=A0ABD4T4F6_9CYAN|nr:hypothetical protein [Lyngbya confervoides]MCM1983407.1 hypothetical protein [Lyngbya confervoides BDU141951]